MGKIGIKRSKKAHYDYMEQRAAINAMASAMWSANLDYIGREGRMTIAIQNAWDRYVEFAFRVTQ